MPSLGSNAHRLSLPTLHTRSSFASEMNSPYEAPPAEAYTHSSTMIPRQDSFGALAFPQETYRAWTTSMEPASSSASASGYETSVTFDPRQHPALRPQPSVGRFPSITAEAYSALNMSNMNHALPRHDMQQRMLPIPAVTQETPQPMLSATEIPEIPPLRSEPRNSVNGLPGRNSLPWNTDYTTMSSSTTPMTCYDPTDNYVPAAILPPTTSLAEGPFGYPYNGMQYSQVPGSPDVSPTSVHTSSDSSTTASMSHSDNRYQGHTLPPIFPEQQGDHSFPASIGHYSSSSTHNCVIREEPYTSCQSDSGISAAYQWPATMTSRPSYSYAGPSTYQNLDPQYTRGESSSAINDIPTLAMRPSQMLTSLQQPQPQPPRTASIEALCRQPSHERPASPPQQQQHHQQHARHRRGSGQESHERHGKRGQSSSSKGKARVEVR